MIAGPDNHVPGTQSKEQPLAVPNLLLMNRRSKTGIARCPGGCRSFLLVLLVLAACQPPATDKGVGGELAEPSVTGIAAPEKILFIGNSFTYYNGGVDSHLEKLAASASPPIKLLVASHTSPGQTLKGHYYDKATNRALLRQQWDIVVLQAASYEPVDRTTQNEFFAYSRRLDADIVATGAGTVFFMTWEWRNRPAMADGLRNAYVKQGNELDALVVPVGVAWSLAMEERPSISLYSDTRHSNLRGTYLAACVFYAALLAESPVNLAYTAGLEQDEARFLQQIAVQATRTFYNR